MVRPATSHMLLFADSNTTTKGQTPPRPSQPPQVSPPAPSRTAPQVLLALLLASLAQTSQGFFSSAPRPTVSGHHHAAWCRPGNIRCAPQRQEWRSVMAAGEGMGGGGRASGGKAKGGGRGRGKKKGKGSSKQGTLIPGPPRLENIPEDKLDSVFIFREKRPGRWVMDSLHYIQLLFILQQ